MKASVFSIVFRMILVKKFTIAKIQLIWISENVHEHF